MAGLTRSYCIHYANVVPHANLLSTVVRLLSLSRQTANTLTVRIRVRVRAQPRYLRKHTYNLTYFVGRRDQLATCVLVCLRRAIGAASRRTREQLVYFTFSDLRDLTVGTR